MEIKILKKSFKNEKLEIDGFIKMRWDDNRKLSMWCKKWVAHIHWSLKINCRGIARKTQVKPHIE